MRGMKSTKDLNDTAAVNEYEAAMRLGNTTLAKNIRRANPDLESDFAAVATLFK